jgi:hypothetical protein
MTPCRHCGSAFNYMACHGSVRQDGTPFDLIFQITCKKCRACGPLTKTVAEAVKGWEHRAEPMLNEAPPPDLQELDFEEAEESSPKEGTADEAQVEILGRRKTSG